MIRTDLDGLRFDPSRTGTHVESYFLRATDDEGQRAVWIKSTVLARKDGMRFAEAWAIAFTRGRRPMGRKLRVPFDRAAFSATDISTRIGECSLTRTAASGVLGAGDERIAYDLSFTCDAAPIYPLPERLYAVRVAGNKPTTPLPDARVSGTVTLGGQTWALDRWRGSLGHNWGKAHTPSYGWAQCSAWDEDDAFLEVAVARVRVAGVPLGFRMIVLRVRGVRYDMSSLRHIARNRGETTLRSMRFRGHDDLATVQGEVWAETDDFAGLHYEDPDGEMLYCLNSKLASARVEVVLRGRPPIVLHTKRAALEIGTRDPEHGIEMIL